MTIVSRFVVVSTVAITLHFTHVTKGGVANAIYFLIFQAAGGDHDPFLLAAAYGKPPSPLPSCLLATTVLCPDQLYSLCQDIDRLKIIFAFHAKSVIFTVHSGCFGLNLISGTKVPVIEFLIY